MNPYYFNDKLIQWQTLANIEHLHYAILDIDEPYRIIDILFKFDANRQIVLHRHKALNKSFVIQGEHRLFKSNGCIQEVRPSGCYTSSPANDEPHREGGGDLDAIVLFSIRCHENVLYEILDDDQNIIGRLEWQNFIDLYAAQNQD